MGSRMMLIRALLSRSLGQKKQEQADLTAMNGLFLALASCLVFTVLGLTCSRLFYTAGAGARL